MLPSGLALEVGMREVRMLQALRAAACGMVVVYHAVGSGGLWPNGAAGVDLFFVISGYVMVASTRRGVGWRQFLARRVRRIVPLYWLLTLAKFAVTRLRPDLTPHTDASLWMLACSLFFIPVHDGFGQMRPILPVGWSLNFEWSFYVLFALTLALGVTPLAMTPVLVGFGNGMVLEFVFGMVVAEEESRSFLKKRTKKLFSICGRTSGAGELTQRAEKSKSFLVLFFKKELLLLSAFVLLLLLPASGPFRCLAWGLPATLIVAAALALETTHGPRLPRWVMDIGDASYAIYLVHPFVVPALVRYGNIGAVVSVPLSVAAGIAVHRLVDAKMQRWLGRARGYKAAGAAVLSR